MLRQYIDMKLNPGKKLEKQDADELDIEDDSEELP
jgi:hypothetical protein